MSFDVVTKPIFAKAEFEWLVHLRGSRAHSAGAPEFTLVFPGPESDPIDVLRHVEAVCAETPRIHFCLRSAMIVPELNSDWFHVFLVPEEGFGAVIRLHDRLHDGPLADCLRPGEPYIPHLTVASLKDFDLARRTKTALNAKDLAIVGRIDMLDLRQRETDTPRSIARIPLARHGLFH